MLLDPGWDDLQAALEVSQVVVYHGASQYGS